MRAPGGRVFALQERAQLLSRLAPAPSLPATLHIQHPIELDLILIPAGEFLMGNDSENDRDAYDDERPQHPVYLPNFYMARTPVTNAQYKVFVDATNHEAPAHLQDGRIPDGKEDHPVVYVSWFDARVFCEWLSHTSGRKVHLSTEAEWEKAARGADGRIYPWGDKAPDDTLCNYNDNVADTTPVGTYPKGASPYGCLDMGGNVWEWTSSLWGIDWEKPDYGYPYKPDDGREDLEAEGFRVLRGGSFLINRYFVRCAVRGKHNPHLWPVDVGFRVVCCEME
jgi:serine/threonine-protein kinase